MAATMKSGPGIAPNPAAKPVKTLPVSDAKLGGVSAASIARPATSSAKAPNRPVLVDLR